MKKTLVKENSYYDSVTLMSLSSKVLGVDGVLEAVISMGTEMNKELLRNVGLATDESEAAGNNDLIIAISAADRNSYEEAIRLVEELLGSSRQGRTQGVEKKYRSIDEAVGDIDANVAVISVPGMYAAREARIALENDMHVMLFSDNVEIEDERKLKEMGREKGLLVMGPDCGTASINNIGLCFANEVRKGNIGIVGASGTGMQEIMVQIHRHGGGISQAIGTGGRDLHRDIGGIMMLEGLKALNKDDDTDVIVLVSKPPAEEVEAKMLDEVKDIDKPVVICFLDGEEENEQLADVSFVHTLYDAAITAVKLSGTGGKTDRDAGDPAEKVAEIKETLKKSQKYFRGLYCGGTLCTEALSIARDSFNSIKSNVAERGQEMLEDIHNYTGNVLLDLGEDEFTAGRPHPMIDPTLRNMKIVEEAEDGEVGVILLDFVLGYGAHEDPVGKTLESIDKARDIAKSNGRNIAFVAYICGTDMDRQDYGKQRKMLEKNGIIVANSNVEAVNMVIELLN
ncbi:MAG TPA: acyl-CoA synthetase FdrA [Tepidimicrobium sp.]|nr:acyl-CoA synthetase FdrA [Tepidimicrobium sp.]